MTSLDHVSAIVHTTFGLVLIWSLVYLGFRDYRIDLVRHRLFLLREELFDYAAEGHVNFNHDAYRLFRERLNGMIRFAHRVTLLRLVLTMVELRANPNLTVQTGYTRWLEALNSLPTEVKHKLVDLDHRMVRAVVVHIVSGSPTLPLFSILWLVNKAVSAISPAKAESLAEQFREPLLDAQALEEQERDLRVTEETDAHVPLPV